jgi:hypothetical protein
MNLLNKIALSVMAVGFVGASMPAEAQIYVRVRPHAL